MLPKGMLSRLNEFPDTGLLLFGFAKGTLSKHARARNGAQRKNRDAAHTGFGKK